MKNEEQVDLITGVNYFTLVAAFLFLIQIMLFFLYYNFTANIYVLGFGWLLLFPGFALVIFSARVQQDKSDVEKTGTKRNLKFGLYKMHFGWSIVSLSLALIIQQWFTYLIAIGFICMMILDFRREQTFEKSGIQPNMMMVLDT